MKESLYKEEQLSYGDIILCNNKECIFIAYIARASNPYICATDINVDRFKNFEPFHVSTLGELEVSSAKTKKWYEKIPEQGIMCWAWDEENDIKDIVIIHKYDKILLHKFITKMYRGFKNAIPLTNEEIKQFIRNSNC